MGNIIIKSGSVGTTEEDLKKFLASKEELETPEKAEAEKKAAEERAVIAAEPKAEDFESEEDFAVAHEEWTVAQQKPEAEEEDEEKEEDGQPKSRTQKKIRKRIDRATAELREELKQTKERLAALEGRAPARKEENPEPKREDFASDAEYNKAYIKWGIEQGLKQQTEKDEKEAEEAAQKQIVTNYWAQVEEAKETHPDWEEVKATLGETRIHSAVQLAIMEKENGAEITYYLGKHPEYTRRLAAMRPLSAVMEVGSLASRLKTGAPGTKAANSGVTTKTKPRLPAPVQPVSTAATASSLTARDIAIKKGSFKDFKARRAAGQ